MYSGSAGGEQSFNSFQQPWRYGSYDPPKQLEDDFQTVWPIAKIPDTQGGGRRLREDNTLNHFTAGCGHSIYRGTATPAFKGSLFICEPVGRLVRRAVSENINGKRVLSNPHGQGEFIRSVDPNFRPVNSATGPDGCLYIVDMYRGIIQQGNWTRKGSYLRGVIDQYGLSKNTSRGRIYRLVPEEGYGKTKQPNMLNESSDELVSHLSHPNAWWRDTARKLMILRADMSVAAKLEQIVESSSSPSYAKVNAIWTLEGLEKLSSPLLVKAAKSKHKDVQIAALQASESLLKEKNQGIIAIHQNLAKHSESEEVRIQAYLSAKNYAPKELCDEMMQYAISGAKADSPRQWFHNIYVRDKKAAEMKAMQIAVAKQKNAKLAEVVESGRKHYSSMCISCHGENGQGVPMAGTNTRLGAPLAGSTRVKGSPEALMRILLNGLVGPIDGKTYPGMMSSMSSLDDKWLADVATYIRNDWGNQSRLITPEMVARIRKETSHRSEPWTIDKLKPWSKDILAERHTWKLNASHNTKELKKAIDGEPKSRWSSLKTQRKSMWISLELPDVTTVGGIILDTTKSPKDFSDELKIEASLNGNIWSTVIADLRVNKPNGSIHFPQSVRAKFIRVTVLKKKSKYWSIHELNLI
jgi:mono/diheme cytochrome c family protein